MTNIEVTTCYSNKFKNKKTPNHNDVFSMKAGQIETQHNAEKQNNQNDRQNRHCGFGNKRCFFLTFLFLHRPPSDPVSFFVI